MILLSASKLNKAFVEDVVFEDVSFHIEDRDKIGFVGVNGAGKTTLFRSLLNPSYADSGEVFTNKGNGNRLYAAARRHYVGQNGVGRTDDGLYRYARP